MYNQKSPRKQPALIGFMWTLLNSLNWENCKSFRADFLHIFSPILQEITDQLRRNVHISLFFLEIITVSFELFTMISLSKRFYIHVHTFTNLPAHYLK